MREALRGSSCTSMEGAEEAKKSKKRTDMLNQHLKMSLLSHTWTLKILKHLEMKLALAPHARTRPRQRPNKTPERQLGKLRLSSSKDQRKTADHDREVAIQKERDRHERLYQEQDLGRKLRKWSTKPIKENLDPLVKTNKKTEALNDKDGYESKSGQIPMKEYKKLLRNVDDDRRDSKMSNSQKKENLERYKKMVKKINSQRDLPGWWPLARSLNELDEEHSSDSDIDDDNVSSPSESNFSGSEGYSPQQLRRKLGSRRKTGPQGEVLGWKGIDYGRATFLLRKGVKGAYSYEFVPDDEVYGFDKEKCPRLAGEESQPGLQRKRNGEVFQSWI